MFRLEDLPWLPTPAINIRQRCKSILETEATDRGASLRDLAQHQLDTNQLGKLAKTLNTSRQMGNLSPLTKIRLGLTSNSTSDLLGPAIIGSCLRFCVAAELVEAPYDQTIQQAMNPESLLNTSDLDYIFVALDYRGLPFQDGVDAALDYLTEVLDAFAQNSTAIPVVQTIVRPPESLFGSFDRSYSHALASKIQEFNARIAQVISKSSVLLVDTATLAENVGIAQWHDPVYWNMAKLPFSPNMIPLYADYVARIFSAARGKSSKCLVLDLDNTCWGGVIGDDGMEGISIGQGDPLGEAHLSVQQAALDLRERGIILAVCSKNNDDIARMPFKEHPDMLLRENHIAVFQANWIDKATNLEAIAETLNIGLDSLVFLDDNPAERAQVRQALPMVRVPELPDEPALYARTLLSAGYFESIQFTQDDQNRAEQYQANAKRKQLQAGSRNLDDYLKSLDMILVFSHFDTNGRQRIVQLINKTNQFNLTTRRYSESDIIEFENDPETITLTARLTDKFGDNGVVAVLVGRCINENDVEIDTWLMSCRVLGRRVEKALLYEFGLLAKQKNKQSLIGTYIKTERNELVEKHYKNMKFELIEQTPDRSSWHLELANHNPEELPFNVKRNY